MRSTLITIFAVALLVISLGMQQSGQATLPQGHPPVAMPDQPAGPTETEADPADVASIESIITAYYDVISGEAGQPRNWDRFHSLFAPEARFVTVRTVRDRTSSITLTPQQFAEFNQKYFERGGYYEREIHKRIDAYGKVAHVFSTYESRHNLAETHPYSRGINSIQLISNGTRWWIVSIMWDYERPDDNPIPAEYLPAS